jgi:hypothetical protein
MRGCAERCVAYAFAATLTMALAYALARVLRIADGPDEVHLMSAAI